MSASITADPGSTVPARLVMPFYAYAAISFLVATILLFSTSTAFTQHYFQPHTLALTHVMALGWATMIILGSSHQLVPVLIESRLYSERLAQASFYFAATGIPMLTYGFYVFDMGWPARWGGALVVLSVICFLINLAQSIRQRQNSSIHAIFMLAATCWLLFTTILGLVLVFNFSTQILREDSLHYLPLHAHAGIIGWFLLLVIGVASRLFPMFLVSKYANNPLLNVIFWLINGALLAFLLLFAFYPEKRLFLVPLLAVVAAILAFGFYCYRSYRLRIRKLVDEPMQMSMLSLILLALPFLFLFIIIGWLLFAGQAPHRLVLAYGFLIFFGWLTSIILGMTFKTLPFIIWNKVYHDLAGKGKTPNPKDLYSTPVLKAMSVAYLLGFVSFIIGIFAQLQWLMKSGALMLLAAAVLYNWNVLKVWTHKAATP